MQGSDYTIMTKLTDEMQWLCRNSSQRWVYLTSIGCHWLLNLCNIMRMCINSGKLYICIGGRIGSPLKYAQGVHRQGIAVNTYLQLLGCTCTCTLSTSSGVEDLENSFHIFYTFTSSGHFTMNICSHTNTSNSTCDWILYINDLYADTVIPAVHSSE